MIVVGKVVGFGALYTASYAIVGMGFMYAMAAGVLARGALGPVIGYLCLASWPLWGLLVGYAAGREAGAGPGMGVAIGAVHLVMMRPISGGWELSYFRAVPGEVWILSLAVVTACALGADPGSRQRRRPQ